MTTTVGIIGGTGPLGRGLAARWSRAGVEVTIGSRDPSRAEAAAADIRGLVGEVSGEVLAGDNLGAARSQVVLLAIPFGALDAATDTLADALADRIVVSVINPLGFDADGPYPLAIEDGSAAVACARRLPRSRVVAAFHAVSSRQLGRLETSLGEDVPVFGDDDDAVGAVVDLAEQIDGVRAVPAGPLRLAGPIEGLTAVIISINRRHGSEVGLRFSHLEP